MKNKIDKRSSSPRKEQGAAMIEFIVVAMFALVPMYLAVQAIAKFGDVRARANAVARYAVWEKTIWYEANGDHYSQEFQGVQEGNAKSAAKILAEARVRVLNDRRNFKYSSKDQTETTLLRGTDVFWRDTAGQAIIDQPANINANATSQIPAKDISANTLGKIGGWVDKYLADAAPIPKLPSKTLASTEITFTRVGEKSTVYQRLWGKQHTGTEWKGLDIQAQGAILSNTWASNATKGAKGIVAQMTPTAYGTISKTLDTTSKVLGAWDLLILTHPIDFGRIDPNVVPSDRLK